MRVLIATLGSVGDFKPCLHLGISLQRMGHDVILAAASAYREMTESSGVTYYQLSGDDADISRHPDFEHPEKGLGVTRSLLLESIEPVLAFIETHGQMGETMLVAPTRVLGARIAAELWHYPLVSVHMAPLYMTTFDGFPSMLAEKLIGEPLDRIRTKYGLGPREQPLQHWQYSPNQVVGLFPEWYAAPQENWPANTSLLDFPLIPGKTSCSGATARFLQAGPAPIVFSPGTYTRNTRAFFEAAVQMTTKLKRRAILTPVTPGQLGDLPSQILALPWAEYGAILPKAAALVHAAGIGASVEALRAGIPQLLVPRVFDQRDNAKRLEHLGVGKTMAVKTFEAGEGIELMTDLLGSRQILSRCHALKNKPRFNPTLYSRFANILVETLSHAQMMANATP